MTTSPVRVRFAPSPSGFMHLGNVRAALINFLYARYFGGTFILRIEDTDAQRTTQTYLDMISNDLIWLSLPYDEGPDKDGGYGPYTQSACTSLYDAALQKFQETGHVYRCFCTLEELEREREHQRAHGVPPRYNRKCRTRSTEEQALLLSQNTPFIWRFALPATPIQIQDHARGTITYPLQDFSDFALTRQDGSYTFLFANAVDDIRMKITHIIRGEDHLSNTALQAALYAAFNAPLPLFYHLPIICNSEGHKLSKRDFGFSLQDLRNGGYLPEAIINYLAIIGGSFEPEIMSLEEMNSLSMATRIHSTGTIQYDLDKLRWINQQWMKRLGAQEILSRVSPLLDERYSSASVKSYTHLPQAVAAVLPECHTLQEVVHTLAWCFSAPVVAITPNPMVAQVLTSWMEGELSLERLKHHVHQCQAKIKEVFMFVREAVTGSPQGLGIAELLAAAPQDLIRARVTRALQH